MQGGFSVLPPQFQVALAPRGPFGDSTPATASLDPHGNIMVSQYEAPYRILQKFKQTFFACNQAAATWSVGVTAAANTGFFVYNPVTSKKNLSLLKCGVVLSAGPVAIAPIGIAQGWFATGIITATATCGPYDGQKGLAAPQANGMASAAATTPAASVYRQWILGGFTAGALPSPDQPVIDEGGIIEIVPGGWIMIAALTAIVGFGFAEWAEVDP